MREVQSLNLVIKLVDICSTLIFTKSADEHAKYTADINNLLPETTHVEGSFRASRTTNPGSPRLFLTASAGSIPAFSTTLITATLQNSAMQTITTNQKITFTASAGTVTPATALSVNGVVSTTLTVANVPDGKTIVSATNGEFTETLTIHVLGNLTNQLYLPLMFR